MSSTVRGVHSNNSSAPPRRASAKNRQAYTPTRILNNPARNDQLYWPIATATIGSRAKVQATPMASVVQIAQETPVIRLLRIVSQKIGLRSSNGLRPVARRDLSRSATSAGLPPTRDIDPGFPR